MHYKNGREAQVGDQVLVINGIYSFVGIVAKAIPGATSCNLYVTPLVGSQCVNAHDALHLDDVGFANSQIYVCYPELPTPAT